MPGNPVRRKPETDLSAIPGHLTPEESKARARQDKAAMQAYLATMPKGDILDVIRTPFNVIGNSMAGLGAEMIGKGKPFEEKYGYMPKTQAEMKALEAMMAVMGPGLEAMDYLKIPPIIGPNTPTIGAAMQGVDRAAARLTADQAKRAAANARQAAKGAVKDLATSDAAYNLANKVAAATGASPKQIMMGEKSKTWRKTDADLAVQMEKEGWDPYEIWRATGTYRAPDGKLRQEIHDWWMEYTDKNATGRQGEAAYKRYKQAIDRANANGADPEEIKEINDWWDKTKQDAYINSKGKVGEYVNHPELKAAYPQLFEQELKQIEPTHPEWAMPQDFGGSYSPSDKSIAINTRLGEEPRRSVALHELQHAIQDIEGWRRGSNPAYMGYKLAEREGLKNEAKKKEEALALLSPDSDLRHMFQTDLEGIQEDLEKSKTLEGLTPYEAYRRVAGEEEARMVQKRLGLTAQEREQRHPFFDYDADPSQQITDFATGGAVMMADGGMITIDEFLKRMKER